MFFDGLLGKLVRKISRDEHSHAEDDEIVYWGKRAKKYGKRSVLNIGHSEDEFNAVTEKQKNFLFPILKEQLDGNEYVALDYGCGSGRFTSDLSKVINGMTIGLDPIMELLTLCNPQQNTCFIRSPVGSLPIKTGSIDLLWVCLVMGGILNKETFKKTIYEFDRVLKTNGLVFLVENTTIAPSAAHWQFLSADEYINIFNFVDLVHVSSYEDLNENISVMVGRKK
jgi:ubiquinone/menaquinone biosynthesis C-methylase UbiE